MNDHSMNQNSMDNANNGGSNGAQNSALSNLIKNSKITATKAEDGSMKVSAGGEKPAPTVPATPAAAPATLSSKLPAGDPSQMRVNPALLEWLKPVQDPEMFLSIVDLGLVYDTALEDEGKKAYVQMTLTSPHCPVADVFVDNVKKRCLEYPGVESAEVKLVFEPKWDPATMASDEVKDRLGIW